MKRTLTVFLPQGTTAEAEAARRALAGPDVILQMATVWAHAPGQKINGDAIVIGRAPNGLAGDVAGECRVVASLDGLGWPTKALAEAEDDLPAEAPEMLGRPSIADLEALPRGERIQACAAAWPRAKKWALLSDEALIDAAREMGAT